MAMAIFTCRPNSHPFEERTVLFPESVKIGRSVAKSRPAANNCIFDCKVLSRNHAILWYEHGKFYLQDTKSSNGTFVNNVRLSKGSEESEPKELKSGDIVQFGVDVVENSKKVTHGCIVASVTLYHSDGKEATRSGVAKNVFGLNENGIQPQEMWQLSQYLQDALYREQMLENKLATLQRIISNCQGLQENHTQTFVQEEKLLSRLETLENQLETLTRNLSEDDIKRELLLMQEDRHVYEMKSKESLRKLLQEKLEAVQKLSDVEKSCASAEDECLHFKSLYERSREEMKDLADKHKERLDEMQSLQDQEEEAKRRHMAVEQQARKEKQELMCQIETAESKEASLSAKVESLQAECDFTKEQLAAMKAQMDKTKEELQKVTSGKENNIAAAQRENDSSEERIEPVLNGTRELEQEPLQDSVDVLRREENGTDSVDSSTDDVKLLQVQLERLQRDVLEKETLVISVKEQLDKARNKAQENQNEVNRLKGELRDLKSRGEEDKHNLQNIEEQVMEYHLQSIDELSLPEEDSDSVYSDEGDTASQRKARVPSLATQEDLFASEMEDDQSTLLRQLQEKIHSVKNFMKEKHCTFISWSAAAGEKPSDTDEEAKEKPSRPSNDQSHEPNWILRDCIEGVEEIDEEFKEVSKLMESEHDEHELLKEELKNAQAYTKEFKKQILDLRDKLLEEQDVTRQKDEFVAQLRRELNELTRERDMAQVERKCEHHAVESAKSAAREMQKQAAKSAEKAGKNKVELSAVTEENRSLKQRIQTLESELKKYRRENNRLLSEHSRLQASYKEVESQSRHQHERLVRQQHNLKDQVEKHSSERRNSASQASALGELLREAELKLKEKEEEARTALNREKERSETLRNYLTTAVAIFVAIFMAYLCDMISLSPGGRLSWS